MSYNLIVNEKMTIEKFKQESKVEAVKKTDKHLKKHVYTIFIIGAKGFIYGGYETFLDKLTEYHQHSEDIQYHIACKANGSGRTDESKLDGVEILSKREYMYHNAHCFKIQSLNVGSMQAIIYDIKSLWYVCNYIKKYKIEEPIVYVLSSRIGFVMRYFAKIIHKQNGQCWHNPDGWEFRRKKYPFLIRMYWKWSERLMVKYSDLEICDSKNIKKYISTEYMKYFPKTTFIAYGADISPSILKDSDPKYTEWLREHRLTDRQFYISVGRFVPENNFEIMIKEFMKSKSTKDFVIITTHNKRLFKKLDKKLNFSHDRRIKFIGEVYDKELLKKIRENAYGYLHGHSVGGTNPSLLEALSSTKLNLLYKIGFNEEVARDSALYWTLEDGNLSNLINNSEQLQKEEIKILGNKARQRIIDCYNWNFIASQYDILFRGKMQN